MPKAQQMHRLSRQRPVSCRFCRSRKLRCSRQTPCSNCISRGVRCELENSAPPSSDHLSTSESELAERIRKLEELVERQKTQPNEGPKQHSENRNDHTQQEHESLILPHTEHLDNDFAWLESIYTGQDLSDKIPSNRVVFKIRSIQHITAAPQYINLSSTSFEPLRCIWLPQYHEAKALMQKFIDEIDPFHHVCHTPSLPAILDQVYACSSQQGQVKPGSMILLLSIFAICTHSWVQHDCERGLFSTSAEAINQSPLWIKATEDVLDIAHRTTSVSIEGVQGMIIMSFILADLEGFFRRCRSLYNMAYMLARELELHFLDHPSNEHLANSVQTEMGRRVWWYLVATDWSVAARFNGVAQGVYQCNLRQMVVKKPLNVNDEDLIEGMGRIEKPLSQPTSMSYSLQRIRLAEISRTIVDRTAMIMAPAGGSSYDVIMDIDTELQVFTNDIPPFFSMSVSKLAETYQLDLSRARNIVLQGHNLKSLFHAQRCKLHLSYFSRGFVDSAYASSREICIQSARLIIQNETRVEDSGLCTGSRHKFIGLLLGVFMASVVLLMDLCHSKASSQKQRGEIADAFRILEGARYESKTAAKFLDSLMQVLRKHNVEQPKCARHQPLNPRVGSEQLSMASGGAVAYSAATSQPYSESTSLPVPLTSPSLLQGNEIGTAGDLFANGEDSSSYFSDLAQSLEQGIDVGNFDWENIFSGLEKSFI